MLTHHNTQKNNSQQLVARNGPLKQLKKKDPLVLEDNRPQATMQRKQVLNMKPPVQCKVNINDDEHLEKEAEQMGRQAVQTKQHHNGLVQRTATPVMQLLTKAVILTLSKAKMGEVNNAFGPHAIRILEAAATTELLDQWIVEINAIHAKVAAAKNKVDNPSMKALERQADLAEHQQAIAERNAKVNEFLATAAPVAPAAAPAWGAGISVAKAVAVKTPAAAAAAPAPAPAPAPVPTLPALGKVAPSYTNHGNFVSLSGAITITRAELATYVKANTHRFEYNQDNGDFVIELGPAKPDGKDWFLTVRYNTKTKTATITHFGPFGAKTSGAIAKAVI